MKTTIDALLTGAGWSGTGTVYSTNAIPEYISGLNATSTLFKFTAINQYLEKTFTNDLTDYDELTISIWSRNNKGLGLNYLAADEFPYKIGIYSGTSTVHEYYLPTDNKLEPVTIKISEGVITKIRITMLSAGEDYLVVSNLIASKDEMPLDIFQGMKEIIENTVSLNYGRIRGGITSKGIFLGNVTAAAGAKYILMPALKYLQKYSVFTITDGTHTETHQVEKTDEEEIELGRNYDGLTLLYSYTAAPMYLTIPVAFGQQEREVYLPGIAIWGMPGEELPMETKIGETRDSYNVDGSLSARYNPVNYKYTLQIDCEARHSELIGFMALMVRRVAAQEYVWINGKKFNIKVNSVPTAIEPTEGYNQIPKMSFMIDVNIREEMFDRVANVKTLVSTLTVTPEAN
jgi:hypothetical protein